MLALLGSRPCAPQPDQIQSLAKVCSQHHIIPTESPQSLPLQLWDSAPAAPGAGSLHGHVCAVQFAVNNTAEAAGSGGSLFHSLLHHCSVCLAGVNLVISEGSEAQALQFTFHGSESFIKQP